MSCLLWRIYEMHPALSLKSGCDTIPAVAADGHTGQSGGALDTALFTIQCVPHQPTVGVWSS
jgi:hypothetical protein